jgi:hypothetical protein
MKWKSIVKTAVCSWSDEDECFVVKSSLFPRIIGTDESARGAWTMFRSMLDDAFDDIGQDRVAGYKKGRPARGGVNVHLQCRAETRDALAGLAAEFEVSQGDVLDFLMHFYENCKQYMPTEEAEYKLLSQVAVPYPGMPQERAAAPQPVESTFGIGYPAAAVACPSVAEPHASQSFALDCPNEAEKEKIKKSNKTRT